MAHLTNGVQDEAILFERENLILKGGRFHVTPINGPAVTGWFNGAHACNGPHYGVFAFITEAGVHMDIDLLDIAEMKLAERPSPDESRSRHSQRGGHLADGGGRAADGAGSESRQSTYSSSASGALSKRSASCI